MVKNLNFDQADHSKTTIMISFNPGKLEDYSNFYFGQFLRLETSISVNFVRPKFHKLDFTGYSICKKSEKNGSSSEMVHI